MRFQRFSKIDLQNGGFFSVKNIFIKKSYKNKSHDIETSWMLLFGPELWFFHKLGSRKPQGWPPQNVKTVTSGIYSLNFRENWRWLRKMAMIFGFSIAQLPRNEYSGSCNWNSWDLWNRAVKIFFTKHSVYCWNLIENSLNMRIHWKIFKIKEI